MAAASAEMLEAIVKDLKTASGFPALAQAINAASWPKDCGPESPSKVTNHESRVADDECISPLCHSCANDDKNSPLGHERTRSGQSLSSANRESGLVTFQNDWGHLQDLRGVHVSTLRKLLKEAQKKVACSVCLVPDCYVHHHLALELVSGTNFAGGQVQYSSR